MNISFEQVLRDYGPLLSRVANSYEANYALRQELHQEIALAVWQALARFENKSSIKTYILKVAHNRAVSHVASYARQPHRDEFEDDNADHSETVHQSPEKLLSAEQAMQKMLEAVRELPVLNRQVVTLSLEGLSYEEISDVCGVTKNHVGVLLKRTKEKLSQSVNYG